MKTIKSFTDAHLLAALRSGVSADEAIKDLYRTQFNRIGFYIKQNNGSDEDAEDIFQEVVLVFIEIIAKTSSGEKAPLVLFYTRLPAHVVKRIEKTWKIKLRDQKFESAKETVDDDVSLAIINREMKAQLMQLVDSLGENCKKILLAFYFENLAVKEILKNLEYENEQVVRNKKYKCLKQLELRMTGDPLIAGT